MPERFDVAGRTVLVLGVRLAGTAAAKALLARGASVLLADRDRPAVIDELEAAGASFLGDEQGVPDGVDLVWVTPGIRPGHPVPVAARAAGIEVIGEAELAWRLRGPDAAPWLAVTGTNGKTTTVRMLEAILLAAGHRALAVGNVGVSVLDAVLARPPYGVLAVELSSFQLYWSSTVTPVAGALLNLAPDHLNWHGSMSDYAAAKARIWRAGTAIGSRDDAAVAAMLAQAPAPVHTGITLDRPGPGDYGVIDGWLVAPGPDGPTPLLPAADIRPVGRHNVENALAAAALAAGFATVEQIAAGLRAFVPDPHRNQLVATRGDVRWVDDSKATNPHAAAASLAAYPRVVWIAGGQLKGAPVEDLVARFADRLAGVVLLGIDRAEIAAALARHAPDVPVFDVLRHDDGAMTEVVAAAAGLARPGDTVLLAPAAASYDMFASYAARGTAFAAAVHALEPS